MTGSEGAGRHTTAVVAKHFVFLVQGAVDGRCYDDRVDVKELVSVDREALENLCRRHGVRRLAVFGSALSGKLGAESDLDLLVEFHPGRAVGLRFITLQAELSGLFGREVDLLTPGFLSPHFRSRVVREAVPLYAAA